MLALLCFAGHILMSRPRRRGWLRVALGLAVTGLLLLAAVGDRALGLPRRDRPRRAAARGGRGHLRRAARPAAHGAAGRGHRRGRARAAQPARRQAARPRRGHGPRLRAAGARCAPTRAPLAGEHRAAVQWTLVLLGGLVLVAWDNPTSGVVLIDAALIALAVGLVAALARGGRASPAEEPRHGVGDRLEQAIEHRADVPGSSRAASARSRRSRRSAARRCGGRSSGSRSAASRSTSSRRA